MSKKHPHSHFHSLISTLLMLATALAALFTIASIAHGQTRINGSQVIEGTTNYCADAGATDAYACSLSPAISAYTTGTCYVFKANTANTGVATININALGAKTIKKAAGGITTDLADNDIRAGQFVNVCYDGTNMQMQSTLGNAAAAAAAGWTLLEQHSAAASASLDFTAFISATYDDYACRATSIILSTSTANLNVQVGTGAGPTWDTAANYEWADFSSNQASATGAAGSAGDTAFTLYASLGNSTTTGTFRANLDIAAPQNAATWKSFTWQSAGLSSASNWSQHTGSATYKSTTALTGIRFIPSSGTITSGTIRCYGLAK